MGNPISASVEVDIVTPINLIQTQQLDIGKFSSGVSAGTANSGGGVTGGVTLVTQGTNALFTVTGDAGATVLITLNTSGTVTDGTNTLNATFSAPASIVLDGSGNGQFAVTAEVAVPASTPLGHYTGNVTNIKGAYPL